jgi:hypothetical protein
MHCLPPKNTEKTRPSLKSARHGASYLAKTPCFQPHFQSITRTARAFSNTCCPVLPLPNPAQSLPAAARTPESSFTHAQPETFNPQKQRVFQFPPAPFLLPARAFLRLFSFICSGRTKKVPAFEYSIAPTPVQTRPRKFSRVRFTNAYETNAARRRSSHDVSRETPMRRPTPGHLATPFIIHRSSLIINHPPASSLPPIPAPTHPSAANL